MDFIGFDDALKVNKNKGFVNHENDKKIDDGFIKIRGYLSAILFPRFPQILGKTAEYGITKWEVAEIISGADSLVFDNNHQITVKGNFYEELSFGKLYTVFGKYENDEKYGPFYKIMYISQEFQLGNLKQEKAFLESIGLTRDQIQELYKTIPNPFEAIANKDVKTLCKVKGIKTFRANKMIEKYEANKDYSEVYIELNEYNFTPLFIQKLIHQYGSPTRAVDIVKHDTYRLIYDMEGIGFKRADEIALKGGLPEKSVERLRAYIVYYLTQEAEENGNSYITAGELFNNINFFFGGEENILEVYYDDEGNRTSTNIAEAIKWLIDKNLLVLEDGENKSRRRVYLTKYWNLEKEISNNLKRLLNAPNRFEYNNWEEDVKALEKRQGFEFDEAQKNGIKLGLDNQVCFITGLGGTGKSSLVAGILASLPKYTFAQCALAGKAAARLQEVTGESGSTIHRLLGYQPPPMGFTYNKNNKLDYDIIILDEVSLVGGEIFLNLIEAIKDGSKLIILGDLGQLSAIGCLNLASDFYNSSKIPTVELTTIHRQAAMSGIITSSHTVRKQEQLFDSSFEGRKTMGELKDMLIDISSDSDTTRARALTIFNKAYHGSVANEDIMKIQLVAPVKERGDACVYNFNQDIQAIVNSNIDSDLYIECGKKDKQYRIYVGDKVMCIKNNYKTTYLNDIECPIFNGWVGMVKAITEESMIIDFPLAGGDVAVPISDAKDGIMLGYCSTVHKLQGSDFPVVIGTVDYSTPPSMLNAPLLYTLITRAKKRCILVGQNGAIRKAISTNNVPEKRTFLQEMLAENN